ncbi:MAG: porphobilinogen synthase [Candidatus Mycalebacterium zealandia]|nr:MAG: porphobilinogen synthase [Candidatus Mycalebacterium zealandia]
MGKNRQIAAKDTVSLDIIARPRRNRKSKTIRSAVRESSLSASNLICPVFIREGKDDENIDSMPGRKRLGENGILKEFESCLKNGVAAFMLFPSIESNLKSATAKEAENPRGLVPQTVRKLKKHFPESVVITDVALDPYSTDGHDGVVSASGEILNDTTVEILCRQALAHADAGADIVAPSDMMDGRVGAIREMLDESGHANTSILSYTAKYASCFYGPFRGALDSAPKSGDKETYQMDPANVREALRELALDEAEGADIVMVKPASHYLDVVSAFRESTDLPVAAYQVSGEYLMIKSAAEKGWINERDAIMESLLSIKRAGADMVATYFAPEAARFLKD